MTITAFIAALLIYGFGLSEWLYVAVVMLYLLDLYRSESNKTS